MIVRGVLKLGLISSICFALVACQETQETTGDTLPKTTGCTAEQFVALIGQSENVLSGIDLPEHYRIIQPNSAVTADYIETRVNFLINKAGLIEDVKCY